MNRLLKEEKAQSEWGSVYMLIVFIIAALLLVAVIKPMFAQSQKVIQRQPSATSV
jgi:competence protein ComGC